jgi:hypothetical protein
MLASAFAFHRPDRRGARRLPAGRRRLRHRRAAADAGAEQAGGAGQGLASSLNIAAFNLGNAFGAWLGGAVIAHGPGLAAVPLVAALRAAVGPGPGPASRPRFPRTPPQPGPDANTTFPTASSNHQEQEMDYRRLGASGLKVSALSFGAGTFGGKGPLFSAWGTAMRARPAG